MIEEGQITAILLQILNWVVIFVLKKNAKVDLRAKAAIEKAAVMAVALQVRDRDLCRMVRVLANLRVRLRVISRMGNQVVEIRPVNLVRLGVCQLNAVITHFAVANPLLPLSGSSRELVIDRFLDEKLVVVHY